MKKNILLTAIGIALSFGVMAQTKDIRKDKKDLKNMVKDKKEDRKEAGSDLGHLRIKAAIKDRKEVRHHRKTIRHEGSHLKKHGVKHPVYKAKKQIKEDKERKQ
jgi:hypothetical protein